MSCACLLRRVQALLAEDVPTDKSDDYVEWCEPFSKACAYAVAALISSGQFKIDGDTWTDKYHDEQVAGDKTRLTPLVAKLVLPCTEYINLYVEANLVVSGA